MNVATGMSKQDIDRMQAGQELDEAVAEKVMGWKRGVYLVYNSALPKHRQQPKRVEQWLAPKEHPEWVASVPMHSPPPYSTYIEKALFVLEHLRQSHQWCCLTIKSDYDFCWRVELTAEGATEHQAAVIVDGVDSLPLAICRAALLAVSQPKGSVA